MLYFYILDIVLIYVRGKLSSPLFQEQAGYRILFKIRYKMFFSGYLQFIQPFKPFYIANIIIQFIQLFQTYCIAQGRLPKWHSGKESTHQCRRQNRHRLDPWVGKDPLEKEMEIHSSIFAWKIPWTEELDGLQSMGSQSQTQLSDLSTKHMELCSMICGSLDGRRV